MLKLCGPVIHKFLRNMLENSNIEEIKPREQRLLCHLDGSLNIISIDFTDICACIKTLFEKQK